MAGLALRLQQRRQTERATSREQHRAKLQEHLSHMKIQQRVLSVCNGRYLSPTELGKVGVDPALAAQQAQQQDAAAAQQAQPPPTAQQTQHAHSDAALAAAAQAQAAATAAAAAAVAQQQQQQAGAAAVPPTGLPPAPSAQVSLPSGMTREQLLEIAQKTPLPQLQAAQQAAAAAYQANATPQNQVGAAAVSFAMWGQGDEWGLRCSALI